MPKVIFREAAANPRYAVRAGGVVDVSEVEAANLVRGGFAEYVNKPNVLERIVEKVEELKEKASPEVTEEEEPETTVGSQPKRKRGRPKGE